MLSRIQIFTTSINNFLWGPIMIALFLFTGLLFTIKTGFFQLKYAKLWMQHTIFSLFKKGDKKKQETVSQFSAMATVLAATVGTGNITGVAAAIFTGGPGAIFWMWLSAFFGMMTAYAENVLGILYRRRQKDGSWAGGAMYYMEYGLKSRVLSISFSIFCILASFGMGNMAQMDSIAAALSQSFHVPPILTACSGMLLVFICTTGGIKRITKITDKLVPFMVILFFLGSGFCLCMQRHAIFPALYSIIKDAFQFRSAAGGVIGYSIAESMRVGLARGVFSNEAGLGSAVSMNAMADVKEPCVQGMWGIFEVFLDTIVVCTLTALVILTAGVFNDAGSISGVSLITEAYGKSLGSYGSLFISVSIIFFAFASVLGWSCFGENSMRYLFGPRSLPLYRILFVLFAGFGSLGGMELVWNLSDMFNGLMAIPNLIALLLLSGKVIRETKKFLIYYA